MDLPKEEPSRHEKGKAHRERNIEKLVDTCDCIDRVGPIGTSSGCLRRPIAESSCLYATKGKEEEKDLLENGVSSSWVRSLVADVHTVPTNS